MASRDTGLSQEKSVTYWVSSGFAAGGQTGVISPDHGLVIGGSIPARDPLRDSIETVEVLSVHVRDVVGGKKLRS